jgi:hypothetical protein
MEAHEGNSRMASGWSCFHKSAPKGKVYNDGKANYKILQEIPLLAPHLQELAGKLQHASFGIPGGKGLFSPVYRALQTKTETVTLT